jgi:beta-galactosidase
MSIRLRHSILLFVAALRLAATEPPLPKGAYPEWDLSKAWKSESPTRSKICINGLWQFRSEARLAPVELAESFFLDELEADSIGAWRVDEIPGGGSIQASVDSERKSHGEASMRVDLEVPKATNFYHITRVVNGVPCGVRLVLRADLWLEMEHDELHLEVQDARDYSFYTARSSVFPQKEGWQTVECEFILPADTPAVKIFILRNHGSPSGCKGRVWIDQVRILKVERPASPGIAMPTDDAWGFTKVPGSWYGRVYWHEQDGGRRNPAALRFGWFRRELFIPPAWTGRRIQLHFDRIATDAHVYCNGQEAGTLGFLGGKIDITPWAEAGKTLDLAVLVEARDSWLVLPSLVTKPGASWQQRLDAAGIVGDVFLLSEPPALRLGDSRIVSSSADRRLAITTPLQGAAEHPLPPNLSWRCDIHDGERLLKSCSGSVPPGVKEILVSETCPELELWDITQPKLYTVTLSLFAGQTLLDQTLPQRFGLREFRIDGKFFYLNDRKLNLVPCSYWSRKGNWHTPEAMRHWLQGAQAAGYNFVYIDEIDRPGRFAVNGHFLALCDELGMLAAISPLAINAAYRFLDKPEIWDVWTGVVSHCVQQHINHPSLVLWRMNMNLNCYAQDQNPLLLDGKMDFAPESSSAQKEAAMLASNAFVRSLDPTRPTYNHACGKSGEIYNLNNYLGWPELQDLREWLRVWATQGDKPLFMAEQATPYPGDFQMRDPSSWWTNEPLLTEYGAIALGEQSYELEEQDYVDYLARCWRPREKKWASSYGYFCHNYPPILDECATRYYEVLLPSWRTWGISGGVNAWENAWRRLIKRQPNSSLRSTPPDVPLSIDWPALQRPGAAAEAWVYDGGGGGEIRTLFDLGRPEEKEYLESTRRGQVYPTLIAPLFAYIGGPDEEWYRQDHAFRSGETVAKAIILLNDRREKQSFQVSWQAEMDGKIIASGADNATVPAAESARLQLGFIAPAKSRRRAVTISAQVQVAGESVPVKPFALQLYPAERPSRRVLSDWQLFDPAGRSAPAFARLGLELETIAADAALPADCRVLVIGCMALEEQAGAALFADLAVRVQRGLQVLIMEQSADALSRVFALRSFTPGARQLWLRQTEHPVLAGIANEDLADWRGATSLGPLAGPPASLDERQRWQRVWRCSQLGVVASTLVEMPHLVGFSPLLDSGFDLRYSALWESREGAGRMFFCLLDVTDRLGEDPVADTLMRQIVNELDAPRPAAKPASARLLAPCAAAPLAQLPVDGAPAPKDGAGQVLVLPHGCGEWLLRHGQSLPPFLASGGKLLAAGLSLAEGQALAAQLGGMFSVTSESHWLNPLRGTLPAPFAGVSPAAIRWRIKLSVTVLNSVPERGWRNDSGVLASIPLGSKGGAVIWIAATSAAFDPAQRPDLVFSRVNSERLYSIVLGNLGVANEYGWAKFLGPGAPSPRESTLYSDQRIPRDDPYADMRW